MKQKTKVFSRRKDGTGSEMEVETDENGRWIAKDEMEYRFEITVENTQEIKAVTNFCNP